MMTPERVQSMITITPDIMKIRNKDERKEKKHTSKTRPHYNIPESEVVCVPADVCAICCEIDTMPNLFRTTCGHVFHEKCIRTWWYYSTHKSCPICRDYIY